MEGITNKQLKVIAKQVTALLKEEEENRSKAQSKIDEKIKKLKDAEMVEYFEYKKNKPEEFYGQLIFEMLEHEYDCFQFGKSQNINWLDYGYLEMEVLHDSGLLTLAFNIDNDAFQQVYNLKSELESSIKKLIKTNLKN